MGNKKNYYFLLFLVAAPVIIYFYYLKWRTTTIYGDDLSIYQSHETVRGIMANIKFFSSFGKFRPVHSTILTIMLDCFHKNLYAYYFINVCIQAINGLILALIANWFIKSIFFSCILGLVFSLSRFSLFNITQLFNGGILEGLAITFCLASLYFILKAVTQPTDSHTSKYNSFLWSILFANISMYTHERYIVLLPFILLVSLLFPGLKTFTTKQKVLSASLVLLSILLNVAIKKFGFGTPFFVGTGGTNIAFSLTTAKSYFNDAVLSIFQINSGPEYLVGITFSSLPVLYQRFVLFFATMVFILFIAYLYKSIKKLINKDTDNKTNFFIFLSLSVVFVFLLIPAIVTIRLEQRWLQASFSVFLLMIAVAINGMYATKITKYSFLSLLTILLLLIDTNYLSSGGNNIYMMNSERNATKFKTAVDNGTIHAKTTQLSLLEKKKDINNENDINWTLYGGYFFDFYQNKSKQLVFIDSMDLKDVPATNFNTDSTQVITVTDKVIDVTNSIK
jgi:hypothetical protein